MHKKEFTNLLKNKLFVLDGAMGTMLQKKGFTKGCPEELNLKNPTLISSIHKAYADVGSDIIITNTFGANRLKLEQYNLQSKVKDINQTAIKIARNAAPNCLIAGGIGPLDKYIEPLDSLTFDEAYALFAEQVKALQNADLLIIETIADIKILKAALIAAKENSNLPILCSMVFEGNRTVTGTDIETYTVIADALGADAIGINCGAGPKEHYELIKIIAKNTNKPLFTEPNAGLPELVDEKTVFKERPETFVEYTKKFAEFVNIIGGCCGTTPEHIRAIVNTIRKLELKPKQRKIEEKTQLCSRTRTITIMPTMIVGERINPTNKKELQNDLLCRLKPTVSLSRLNHGA